MASTQAERRPGHEIARDGRRRWVGLAMLSVGVAMIIVDATIVNVAVPSIIRDLSLDSTQAEWINTVYALVFAALLITLGRLGDVHGRRRMYVAGLVVFIIASVVAGLAPNGDVLILARRLPGNRWRDDPALHPGDPQLELPGTRSRHRLRGLGVA